MPGMGLPTFQQLMLPTLQTLGRRHEEIGIAALEDAVSKGLRISSEQLARMRPSGNQTVFSNRLNWARSYLTKACLIELPRRGYCRATDRGRALLAEGVSRIDVGVLERYPEFAAWRAQNRLDSRVPPDPPPEDPEKAIASSFDLLNSDLARQIVRRVHSFPPAFFERLIIDLEPQAPNI